MIKIKLIELLNVYSSLNKILKNDSWNVSLQFKYRVALLFKDLEVCITQYQTQLSNLMKEYNITINKDGEFIYKDDTNKEMDIDFYKKLSEIQHTDLEINHSKIKFDIHMNGLSPIELLNLSPFFDYDEIIESIK